MLLQEAFKMFSLDMKEFEGFVKSCLDVQDMVW